MPRSCRIAAGKPKVLQSAMSPSASIGLDGIEAGVLQRVGLQLRHQPDAAPFLMFIDHEAASFSAIACMAISN